MLDTLGGRFLKRAVPQDANEVPLNSLDLEVVEEPSRQSLPEANRRVYTSAAMLGLAISVGAYGLLAPRQGDAALAVEPIKADANSNVALPSVEVPAAAESVAVASASSSSLTIKHAVQEGQTLSQVAELYRTSVEQIVSLNRLQPDATLYVGQVLNVPANAPSIASSFGASVQQLPELKPIPVVTRPIAVNPAQPLPTVQASLTAQPKPVLQTLQQKRNQLKQSLAELKSEESKTVAQALPTVESQPQSVMPNTVAHQVRPGETLSSIAQTYGLPTSELVKLNKIENPNLLTASQVIQVPQAPTVADSSVSATVEVPVVPSLGATQASPSLAVGGSSDQVAFVKPDSKEHGSMDVRSRSNDSYVNNLVSEIARLRQKYQSRSAAPEPQAVARVPRASLFANPARRAAASSTARQIPALRTESRNLSNLGRQAQLKTNGLLSNAPKQDQLVATANVGSESHSPLLRSSVGKVVSPALPSLGRPDSYLPGADRTAGSKYIWPAQGQLSSGYGWRWGRMHKGIDIAAPVGTPIVAAAAGTVVSAGWNDGGYGNLVEVEHSDGSSTLYAHNSRIVVKVGQQVRQGEQIAAMGSTGFSTGPHSHFEVHLAGRGAVNPMAFLNGQPRS